MVRLRLHPLPLMLLALQDHWTEQQRKDFMLGSREKALEHLVAINGKSYGYSLWRWSLYFLSRGNLVGIGLMWGNITGANLKWLAEIKEARAKGVKL